jgi:hypothetical protein
MEDDVMVSVVMSRDTALAIIKILRENMVWGGYRQDVSGEELEDAIEALTWAYRYTAVPAKE